MLPLKLRSLRHIAVVSPAVGYFKELIPTFKLTRTVLRNCPTMPGTRNPLSRTKQRQFLYPVFGLLSHDMALGWKDPSRHKLRVGSISVLFTLLVGLMDDVLDDPMRDLEERKAFVTNLSAELLEGERHESEDPHYRVCFWLAQHLFGDFFIKDEAKKAKLIFEECVSWLKKQPTERDPERLLLIEQGAGGSFCEMIPILSEIEMNCSFPEGRAAARRLGAGSQLLDDWVDLDIDLRDQINTYATMRLKLEGDHPDVRASIRQRYFDMADALIEEGASMLDTESQKEIYRVMSGLIDARYRWSWGPYTKSLRGSSISYK